MTWQLKTAAVQLRSTGDLAANLATCQGLIADAAKAGARLIVLPECFSILGRHEGDKMVAAESYELGQTGGGPVFAMLAAAAKQHDVWIIGGGTPETVVGDARRAYNTCVVVDPAGALVAKYRKIHLFDVDIPGGATLKESDGTVAGDSLHVVEIDGVKVGLSICYDLRFPELYRELALDRGAEVVVIPAAFTAHTGAAHWHVLQRARAIENQVWVVSPAQWGKHNEKRESYGHSLIIDPWGVICAEKADGDGVIVHTLDSEAVAKRRTQMPVARHAVLWKK
ncbi:MAG: carbon-nitrogen hydrolase family protein [Kofleriaceae bacterium]